MRISDWSSDVCSSDLHIFGFKTGRKAFQFPPLQGFMACGEALLVAILPRKQRIDGMPFGGISGDCGSVAHHDRKSVVSGKRVYARVDLGGRRIIKNKKNKMITKISQKI